MHLFINLYIIFAVWKWADYKNWEKYHTTMLFLPFMSLVYDFLSHSSEVFLWRTIPDFILNDTVTELTYVMILLPCTVLLFLSNYPSSTFKVAVHFLKYIFIYSAVEALAFMTERMTYSHGWSIWHSVLFYFLMFPAIIIHHKRPIIAYIVFILITIFGVWYFKIPVP